MLLQGAECPASARLQLVIMSLVLLGRHLRHDHDRPAWGTGAVSPGGAAVSAGGSGDGPVGRAAMSAYGWYRFGYESDWVLSAARTWP